MTYSRLYLLISLLLSVPLFGQEENSQTISDEELKKIYEVAVSSGSIDKDFYKKFPKSSDKISDDLYRQLSKVDFNKIPWSADRFRMDKVKDFPTLGAQLKADPEFNKLSKILGQMTGTKFLEDWTTSLSNGTKSKFVYINLAYYIDVITQAVRSYNELEATFCLANSKECKEGFPTPAQLSSAKSLMNEVLYNAVVLSLNDAKPELIRKCGIEERGNHIFEANWGSGKVDYVLAPYKEKDTFINFEEFELRKFYERVMKKRHPEIMTQAEFNSVQTKFTHEINMLQVNLGASKKLIGEVDISRFVPSTSKKPTIETKKGPFQFADFYGDNQYKMGNSPILQEVLKDINITKDAKLQNIIIESSCSNINNTAYDYKGTGILSDIQSFKQIIPFIVQSGDWNNWISKLEVKAKSATGSFVISFEDLSRLRAINLMSNLYQSSPIFKDQLSKQGIKVDIRWQGSNKADPTLIGSSGAAGEEPTKNKYVRLEYVLSSQTSTEVAVNNGKMYVGNMTQYLVCTESSQKEKSSGGGLTFPNWFNSVRPRLDGLGRFLKKFNPFGPNPLGCYFD